MVVLNGIIWESWVRRVWGKGIVDGCNGCDGVRRIGLGEGVGDGGFDGGGGEVRVAPGTAVDVDMPAGKLQGRIMRWEAGHGVIDKACGGRCLEQINAEVLEAVAISSMRNVSSGDNRRWVGQMGASDIRKLPLHMIGVLHDRERVGRFLLSLNQRD